MEMHADEIEINVSLVQSLIADQFPQWANLPVTPVASMGTDNALFRIGNAMQARLPRVPWAVASVAKESTWLPQIAPFISTPITIPLQLGKPTKNYPYQWMVASWIDGTNPEPGSPACGPQVAADAAKFIQQLRQVSLPDSPPTPRGAPLSTRDKPTRTALTQLEGLIDVALATRIWDEVLEIPYWDQPPVWLHGDLLPGNMLIKNERLSGVIDFSCMGVGDPAADLILAWNLLDANTRRLFRKLLQVDDNMWLRGCGRALSHSLVIIPYYKNTNPQLTAVAQYTLGQIFADYRDTTHR